MRKYKSVSVPAVREHVIRVTGATEDKFGTLILNWRKESTLPDSTNF